MNRSHLHIDYRDRAKAVGAALMVHLLIGAALLTSLALHLDRQIETGLVTFNVPPAPVLPPPQSRSEVPDKFDPAPTGRKAAPSPIVAPSTKIPTAQTLPAAPVAGQGTASSAGAAANGSGSGAGGAGEGMGGSGGIVGARLLTGELTRSDYRQIAALGSSRGSAELLLLVNTLGRVERCRAVASSGNPQVDATLCQLLSDRARFAPAHSTDGSLFYQDVHYFPRWGH